MTRPVTPRVRPARLYLIDAEHYRVRYLDGSVVHARWRDAAMRFEAGRGEDRRPIDMARVAAVSPLVFVGRAGIPQWWPFDDCYRARFAPPPAKPRRTWTHPYRTAA